MQTDLATTNVLLAIMAAVSVLDTIVLIGVAIGAFMTYRRVINSARLIEVHHISPTLARIEAILNDVKSFTATIRDETERVDHAIRTTIDHVDCTVDRVRSNVRAKADRIFGVVRGMRTIVEQLLVSGGNGRGPRWSG
jgi:hypothetical protein